MITEIKPLRVSCDYCAFAINTDTRRLGQDTIEWGTKYDREAFGNRNCKHVCPNCKAKGVKVTLNGIARSL